MRRSIHDGYLNRHIVHKDGKQYELRPLISNVADKDIVMCFGDKLPVNL